METNKKVLLIGLDYAINNYFSNHIPVLNEISSLEILRLDISKYKKYFSRRGLLSIPIELVIFLYILIRHKPEIVITAGPKIGLITSITSFILRKKHLHWYTGQVWANNKKFSLAYLSDYIISRLSTNLYADGASQSKFLKEKLKINKEIIVPKYGSINGIDNKFFNILKNDENVFRVSYVGRLTSEKGIFKILEVAKLAEKNNLNILFSIAGPKDEYFKEFSQFINISKKLSNVEVNLGFIDPCEIFSKSDLFILPSEREGFGSILVEAQACGLPVIVSNIYGVKNSLLDNETGFFCDLSNINSFYKKIELLYTNYELRSSFSKNAKKFAMNFKQDIFKNNLKHAYRKSNLFKDN